MMHEFIQGTKGKNIFAYMGHDLDRHFRFLLATFRQSMHFHFDPGISMSPAT